MDPMNRSYASESPYSFAGNSPIELIDFNGMFKISPYFVKKYPTLARMIKYYLPLLKDNFAVRDAWIDASGYKNKSEGIKAFEDMVTYGSGPWVTPSLDSRTDGAPLGSAIEFYDMGPNRGVFDRSLPNNIGIDNFSLQDLETAVSKGDHNEVAFQMFVVSTLIMHESAHWGKFKNVGRTSNDYIYEEGALWEENFTGGSRFSYRYPKVADYSKQAYDINASRDFFNKTVWSSNDTKLFGLTIFPNYGRIGDIWNPKAKYPLPSGTAGDEVLKKGKIKEPYLPSGTYYNGTSQEGSSSSYHN